MKNSLREILSTPRTATVYGTGIQDLDSAESWDALALLVFLSYEEDNHKSWTRNCSYEIAEIFDLVSQADANDEQTEQLFANFSYVLQATGLDADDVDAYLKTLSHANFYEAAKVFDLPEGWLALTDERDIDLKRKHMKPVFKTLNAQAFFSKVVAPYSLSPIVDYIASHLLVEKLRSAGAKREDVKNVAVFNPNWVDTIEMFDGLYKGSHILDRDDEPYFEANVDAFTLDVRAKVFHHLAFVMNNGLLTPKRPRRTKGFGPKVFNDHETHIYQASEAKDAKIYDGMLIHADALPAMEYKGQKSSFDAKAVTIEALSHLSESGSAVLIVRYKDLIAGNENSLDAWLEQQDLVSSELLLESPKEVIGPLLPKSLVLLLIDKGANNEEVYSLKVSETDESEYKDTLFVCDLDVDNAGDAEYPHGISTGDAMPFSDALYDVLDELIARKPNSRLA